MTSLLQLISMNFNFMCHFLSKEIDFKEISRIFFKIKFLFINVITKEILDLNHIYCSGESVDLIYYIVES